MIHIATVTPLRFLVWLAPLAVAVGACESTGPGSRALSLSVTTKSATSMASASADPSGGSISLSAAQVTLKEIELNTTGTSCGAETDNTAAVDASGDEHNEDCAELELGPLQVNLPLDPTTQLVLDALVPAGTYTGVQAKLEGVTVSGTFTPAGGTAQAFTFTADAEAEIEMEFATPITVGPGTSNFTVSVDVASWFKDASGAFLDPNDPANAETINANIRHSFRAFGDEDHDGVDDDHEAGGGH
jgi:hypothetical protein